MHESIFTKIINGEIPCHKIYEDDKTFAFMDIHPIQPGTVVVVSKTQIENFYELNDADYTALWVTIKKIAKQMKIVFPVKKRIAVKIEGLDVAHAHATVFPIDSGEEFRAEQDTDSEPDHQMLADLAAKLAIPITSV